MFNVNVVAYPWDLEDEGIEHVLERLRGEFGVTGVTVPAAVGPLWQFRRHRNVSPRMFRTDGGALYHPNASRYVGTRCKPVGAEWLKQRDPIARTADAAARLGLSLRLRVAVRSVGRLAGRFPTCAAKNAFEEPSHAILCGLNPDVVQMTCAMIADLAAQFAPDMIELGDMATPFLAEWRCRAPSPFAVRAAAAAKTEQSGSADLERMLSICFCESCLQHAHAHGVDTAAAMKGAAAAVNQIAADGSVDATPDAETRPGDPDVDAYVAVQARVHATTLQRLTEGDQMLGVLVAESDQPTMGNTAAPVDGCRVILQLAELAPVPRDAVPNGQRMEVCLPASAGLETEPSRLVRAMKDAADAGVVHCTLDHYGVMGRAELQALKQAVRYARRSSEPA